MKKLLKSEICGFVNSARNPCVAENGLKSQNFQLKKKKGETQTPSKHKTCFPNVPLVINFHDFFCLNFLNPTSLNKFKERMN